MLAEHIALQENETTLVNTSQGYVKINVNDINYIDIVKRNLCYHLVDNSEVLSVTIRKAFTNYIGAFQHNTNFIFIEPAFLINLNQITRLEQDRVEFKNGSIAYINKKQYTSIKAAWSKQKRATPT